VWVANPSPCGTFHPHTTRRFIPAHRRFHMKRLIALLVVLSTATFFVQGQQVSPYKLGTFQNQGRTFVGIVLRDSVVVDFAAASRAITPASNVALPADMKDLIAR